MSSIKQISAFVSPFFTSFYRYLPILINALLTDGANKTKTHSEKAYKHGHTNIFVVKRILIKAADFVKNLLFF